MCIKSKTYNNCWFQPWWLSRFYVALQNPHIFGNVLSMSGSVHWKKDNYENTIPWIENQISSINSNATHLYPYIAVGELENEPL